MSWEEVRESSSRVCATASLSSCSRLLVTSGSSRKWRIISSTLVGVAVLLVSPCRTKHQPHVSSSCVSFSKADECSWRNQWLTVIQALFSSSLAVIRWAGSTFRRQRNTCFAVETDSSQSVVLLAATEVNNKTTSTDSPALHIPSLYVIISSSMQGYRFKNENRVGMSPASLIVSQMGPVNLSSPFLIFSNSFSFELDMNGASPHSLQGHTAQICLAIQCMYVCVSVCLCMLACRVTYSIYMITPMLHTSHC